MTENTAALADRCMTILCEHVGVVNAEQFLLFLRSDEFDYTKWQRERYGQMTPEEVYSGIIHNGEEHPFQGKKAVIL